MAFLKPSGITGLDTAHPLYPKINGFWEIGQLDKELLSDTSIAYAVTPAYQDDVNLGDSRLFQAGANSFPTNFVPSSTGSLVVVLRLNNSLSTQQTIRVITESGGGHAFAFGANTATTINNLEFVFRGGFGSTARLTPSTQAIDGGGFLSSIAMGVGWNSALGPKITYNGLPVTKTTDTTNNYTRSTQIPMCTNDSLNANISAIVWFDELTDSELESITTDTNFWQLVNTGSALTPIAFTGTIPNFNFTAGDVVSEDLSPFFSGTETPFSFENTGTALTGSGLTLSSAGLLSGTATESSITGVIVTGTDAATNTAASNAFNVTVAAAANEQTAETGGSAGVVRASIATSDAVNDQAFDTAANVATVRSASAASESVNDQIFDTAGSSATVRSAAATSESVNNQAFDAAGIAPQTRAIAAETESVNVQSFSSGGVVSTVRSVVAVTDYIDDQVNEQLHESGGVVGRVTASQAVAVFIELQNHEASGSAAQIRSVVAITESVNEFTNAQEHQTGGSTERIVNAMAISEWLQAQNFETGGVVRVIRSGVATTEYIGDSIITELRHTGLTGMVVKQNLSGQLVSGRLSAKRV